ncbi:GNAT family N-acetyltransferase [Streptomyces sp. NBC_00690]|uniref:GNAT family N-acetyltransferase n=1 Tax=Streptomyces sp. NBC_00690 TaxID=2975808 RepID=UPI002E2B45C3|nr:GNAT family N-acetyltransferase [Streptomyces sp. NBC_00690]
MDARIREYRPFDEEPVVELSLRAWAPVFDSMRSVLGDQLFLRLHGDWRTYQERAVRQVLSDGAMKVWVAATEARVVGFAAATVADPTGLLGEISMLAVDPNSQGSGVGGRLTEHATTWLRDAGMQVAMIDTGGDAGHAPARQVYEQADYTLMPIARYFKAL